jgi:hypothetical protein
MTDPPGLFLTRGPLQWAIDHRPVSIGRQPECDITLGGEKVSRVHAYVVPTPSGPLWVDRSRLGTTINGERMQAPWVLADGDLVQVVGSVLRVERRSGRSSTAFEAGKLRSPAVAKATAWLRRYGPSEVLGTVVAVGSAVAVQQATHSTVVAAYVSTIGETAIFYGVMFLRESIRAAHRAGAIGKQYGSRDLVPVLRNLVLEFGVAETLDAAIVRPLLMGLGLRWIGGSLGALAGKLGADLAFYGPVLTIYEWQLARRTAADQVDRRRRTTATNLTQRDP